jgi:hypothetical protein
MNSQLLIRTGLVSALCVMACDPTAAVGSATQSDAPVFHALDAGTVVKDGGSSADAGMPARDAGPVGSSDAGPSGLTILSTGNHLPKPWLVTDARLLVHTQPLDGGTEALMHVGQWVELASATTSDNTVVDDDHCPNIFMGMCDGFAAKDSASHIVLVDSFVLLGSGMSDCTAKFNGVSLPTVTGIWAGRFLSATMVTSYSLALNNCAGLGVGALPAFKNYAPATTDIQDLQASYPSDKRAVTVHGVVIGVAINQSKQRTMFIEDPGGGALSGIAVFSSAGLSPVPNIGDYVVVSAVADKRGDFNQLVLP